MKLKKLAALAVCGALLFATACGTTDGSSGTGGNGLSNTSADSGRFVEKDITPGDGADMLTMKQFSNGNLVCFSSDYSRRWDSADGGETWAESAGFDLGEVYINSATLLEDGSLLAGVMDLTNYEETGVAPITLVRYMPDGTQQPLPFADYDEVIQAGNDPYISYLQPVGADKVLFGYGWNTSEGLDPTTPGEPVEEPEPEEEAGAAEPGGEETGEEDEYTNDIQFDDYHSALGLYDLATGEKLLDLGDDYVMSAVSDGEILYLLMYGEAGVGITAYTLSDGTPSDKVPDISLPEEAWEASLILGEDGSFYTVGQNGLTRYANGEAETLLDSMAYTFGDASYGIWDAFALADGSFILHLYNGSTSEVLKYTFDPDATIDPDKVLNVWSLYDNPTVRASISAFRRANPDGLVNYNYVLTDEEDDTIAPQDAIRNLNTEILAGNGPDVIILDGVPMESYVNQGVLADLTDLVDTSGMYSQLADAFKTEGGTYYLPMRFTMPVLASDSSSIGGITTLEDLLDTVRQNPDYSAAQETGESTFAPMEKAIRPALLFANLSQAFDTLWQASAPAVVQNNTLNTEALATFLDALKTVSDANSLHEIDPDERLGGGMAMSMAGSNTIAFFYGSPLNYLTQRAHMGAFTAEELSLLYYMMENPNTTLQVLPGAAEGSWNPTAIAGINAASGVQELAADFINTMLSDSVQGTRLNGGFAVTRAGMQKQMADLDEMYADPEMDMDITSPDMDALIATFGQPNLTDAELKGKIKDIAVEYCQGRLDLEGAVSRIEQDIKNYLAERQ